MTLQQLPMLERDKYLDNMLDNWSVWAHTHEQVGPEDPTSCGSAERAYTAPVWETDEPPPLPPEIPAAELVERIWSSLEIEHRAVLKVRYIDLPLRNAKRKVYNEDRTAVVAEEDMPEETKDRIRASRAGMFVGDYEKLMREARAAVWKALSTLGSM